MAVRFKLNPTKITKNHTDCHLARTLPWGLETLKISSV
jgi:hypothetical protein